MDPLTIIAAATAAFETGTKLVTWIQGLRDKAKQTGEWTDEQEKAFEEMLAARAKQPQWQPDSAS